VADLLIRNIEPALKRRLEQRARRNRHSLSQEAKALIQRGLVSTSDKTQPGPRRKLGTYLFSLLEDQYRGDDLVFEIRDYPTPPNFE
jgi:antitoxin FitA